MAYRRANYRGGRRYGTSFAAKRTGRRRGFSASPAGQHRRLAMNAFRIARAAGARGNQAHRRRMIAAGKRALALSKAEFRLWKRGLALRARALATHRAAKRRAQAARRAPVARARFRYA